jgi:hypothetical protein
LRWNSGHPVPFGAQYWNTPIFAPATGTFAWSEPQPFTGWMFDLLRHLGGDAAGYNLVLLVTLMLNGVAGSRLARLLGAGGAAAFVTGAWFQLLPFTFGQLGVLQLTVLWPLLLMIAALVAWLREPTLAAATTFGAASAVELLSCGNLALVGAMALAAAVPLAVSRQHRVAWPERLGGIALASAIVFGTAGPIVLAQQHRLAGRRWSDTTILAGSATARDWWFGGRAWPGLLLIAVAACGVWLGRRCPTTRLIGGIGLAGLVISIGSHWSVFGVDPWHGLADVVPAIGRLRSPWRAAAVVQIALVALAVPALERVARSWRWVGLTVALVVVAVGALETGVGPGTLVQLPSRDRAVVEALAELADGSPIAYLPVAPGPRAADFESTVEAMLTLLDTGHAMVNGYSGFFPSDHQRLRELLAGFPDSTSRRELERRGVRFVVADRTWFDRHFDTTDTSGLSVVATGERWVLLDLGEPELSGRPAGRGRTAFS